MALTLYAALVLHSYILVLLFSALQAAAVAWYLLSYVPGGAPILRLFTRGCLRAVSACCCRSSSSGMMPGLMSSGSSGILGAGGGSSGWPSVSRGGSSGLLPL